jgi:hypothetical protein
MTKMRTYQCPECTGQFDYLHHPNITDDPAPRFCPLCGYDTDADAQPLTVAVTAPHLTKGAARNVDGIWEAEQRGAEHRALMAQSMGLDSAEAANLKVTNMMDAQVGEITAPPLNNPVTQIMERAPQGTFGFVNGAQQGIGYSQLAHTGVAPNAGLKMLRSVKIQHSEYAPVSDLPAKETQEPGYRPR